MQVVVPLIDYNKLVLQMTELQTITDYVALILKLTSISANPCLSKRDRRTFLYF